MIIPGTVAAGGGSAPVYATGAVSFDGATTWLTNAALNAGTDSRYFSFSGWFQFNGNFTTSTMFVNNPGGPAETSGYSPSFSASILHNAGGNLSLNGGQSFGVSPEHYVYCEALYPAPSTWVHVMGSLDCYDPTNSGKQIIALYINGVNVTLFVDSELSADVNLINGLNFWIGTDTFDDIFLGDMADLWIAPRIYFIDSSTGNVGNIPAATVAKFRNPVTGKPVDLGADGSIPTGTAPTIFLRRAPLAAASTFATNLGTGGDFTITGALTNAPSSPSD